MKPPFPVGTIDRFFPETQYFFLSNFFPSSVTFEGLTYPTVEHAYQAAKSLDHTIRLLFLAEPTPARAKRRGSQVKLRPEWDRIKFTIMQELLLQKFAPDSVLEQMLWQTKDHHLIEGNYWHDLVWGQCFCPRHAWDGANRLGGILMDIRAGIQEFSHAGDRSSSSLSVDF